MIKKYNNKKNLSGSLIEEERKNKHLSRIQLSNELDLQGVYINRDELRLMENNKLMIKDFELIAISKILDIDLNKLKNYLDTSK